MAGLYIHIPFCKSRCIYCSFYSTTHHELMEAYVDALILEMTMRAKQDSPIIDTVYLGGGTPSQLPTKLLYRLFHYIYKVYNVSDNAEITIECNPDDISADYAAGLSTLPVNRISMGAQTFSDERLRFLRRRHTACQVEEAVRELRRNGLSNISIDLMFGFPEQSIRAWNADIDAVLRLNVEHISAYLLTYEEGTPLYRMRLARNNFPPADEENERQMYETLIDRLEDEGFEHYEISNFARLTVSTIPYNSSLPSFRSRHNSSYWHAVPYIGIGAAAHSYDEHTRSWNYADLKHYTECLQRGTRPTEGYELIDEKTRYNDLITTALRTREGISLQQLAHDFKPLYTDYLLRCAQQSIEQGLLVNELGNLHLTRKGLFVSDNVMSDLIYIEDD